jgi:hypothetical protein
MKIKNYLPLIYMCNGYNKILDALNTDAARSTILGNAVKINGSTEIL